MAVTSPGPGADETTEVSVALAGLGTIAQTIHLPLLERLAGRFRLAAIADVSPTLLDRIGGRYAVPAQRRFADARAMLAHGGFDAVLLLTSGSHAPVAAAALRRGTAVLSEKPLGYAHAELDALEELSGPDSGRLMVGYMKQYDPAAQRLARLLKEVGGAAAVHSVEITVLHPSTPSQLAFAQLPRPAGDVPEQVRRELRAELERPLRTALGDRTADAARVLYELTLNSICHELSLIRLFAGAPATVDHAALWPWPAGPRTALPSVELSGSLPHGGRYGIRWLYQPDYPAYRETVTVHHATGSLELVFPSPYLLNAPTVLTEVTPGGDAPGTERRTVYRGPVGGFEAELAAFHALVTHGTPALSGLREARADITTAQQVVRRFAGQRGLRLDGEAAHD